MQIKMARIVLLFLLWQSVSATAENDENRFLAAGVPATSRDWYGPDYAQAAKVLSEGKVGLPSLSDKQGTALIEHITSVANLSACHNKNFPMNARFPNLIAIQDGTNSILKLYLVAANSQGPSVHEELTRMMAFTLQVAAEGMRITNEFVPTIPHDDKYETRMKGLKLMYSGITTEFAGATTSLSETYYSEKDNAILIDAMANTLPKIKGAFPQDYRVELKVKLLSLKEKSRSESDRKNLARMLKELELP